MPDTHPNFQDIREAVSARAYVNVEAANACLQWHGGEHVLGMTRSF
ncbi:hypothetical protein [Bordetella genomosp. 6]|nr:hypothetical protein [Bordetella genomosp. 6]